MKLTAEEFKVKVKQVVYTNNIGAVSEEDLQTLFLDVADSFAGGADTTDLNLEWDPLEEYDLELKPYSEYDNKLWKTKVNANINNIPAENAYWEEVSKSTANPFSEWAAGVYLSGLILVFYHHPTDGPNFYKLNADRPFQSTNIVNEITAGKWIQSGGGEDSRIKPYANITARNTAATGGALQQGQIVFVLDATGDSSVSSGYAYYEYSGTGTDFNKISEQEALDYNFSDFTRNSTGESNLDITPANATFFTSILTGGKAKLKAILDFIVTKIGNIGTKPVNETGLASGKILQYNGTEWVMIDTPSGGGGGAFSTITGNATDNTNLRAELAKREKKFNHNSDLYTSIEQDFRGHINNLSTNTTAKISSVTYDSRLDTATEYTAHASIQALQTWITANCTGTEAAGTKFWIRSNAVYAANQYGKAVNSLRYSSTIV